MTTRLQNCFYLLISISLGGCDQPIENTKTSNEPITQPVAVVSTPVPPTIPTAAVLATVNGYSITADELKYSMARTFSELNNTYISEDIRQNVLDSLIAAKAMELSVKNELSEQKLAHIKNQVKAYEQELYVKEYLSRHVAPQSITTKMIKSYYNKHLTEFGAGIRRSFELLVAEKRPTESQRNAFLKHAETVAGDRDWHSPAEYLKKRFGVQYQRSWAIPDNLDPRIRAILDRLSVGESSKVNFIDGKPIMARITGEQVLQAKPMSEVSAEIRKRLAPVQLRKAVKKATTEIVSQSEITKYKS